MGWNMAYEMINAYLLGVVAACWALGYILKKTPKIPSWSIVYIVTLLSVGLVISMNGMKPDSLIQGILCGAFAVYGHQLIKQGKEGFDHDENSH